MTMETASDNELILIEPQSDQFILAIQKILKDHSGRAIRMIGTEDGQAGDYAEAMRPHYPESDISITADTTDVPDGALVVIFEQDGAALQKTFMPLLDGAGLTVIAPVTDWHCSRRPLYLISIPKSGTHLLYGLAEAFGYAPAVTTEAEPLPGQWYCLEYTNSHTSARDFFVDSVRRSPNGGRHHPFPRTPTLFMYRNPLDVVVSEANYYHRDGNTLFAPYLSGFDFEGRLQRLINDPWALGSIRDRMGVFTPWLDCVNVMPLSFEEIVGSRGGGSDAIQSRLIWSLQLKLQIPGKPSTYARKVFNPDSPTFNGGQVGRHREKFTAAAWDAFRQLPQDFMAAFGYGVDDAPGTMPRHAERLVQRAPRYMPHPENDPPFLVERAEFYAIVRYQDRYYPFTGKTGDHDLVALTDEARGKLLRAPTLALARMIAFQNL